MNKNETLALFARGCAAWNDWAASMWASRQALVEAGGWQVDSGAPAQSMPHTPQGLSWIKEAHAEFGGHHFRGDANFEGFVFPGNVNFGPPPVEPRPKSRSTLPAELSAALRTEPPAQAMGYDTEDESNGANFAGNARFIGAAFYDNAVFKGAVFARHAEFDGATFSGPAQFDNATFQADAMFDGVLFKEAANFAEVSFDGYTDFSSTTFTQLAWFSESMFLQGAVFNSALFISLARFTGTVFEKSTNFDNAKFRKNAVFETSRFSDQVSFEDTLFAGHANFKEVCFEGDVAFEGAAFKKDALFDRTAFEEITDFSKAELSGFCSFAGAMFEHDAYFNGSNVAGVFNLEDVSFANLPDFTGAHFDNPPQLSKSHLQWGNVERLGFWQSVFAENEPDVAAKFRALKHLALQGHDRGSALLFFAGEMRAGRSLAGYDDKRRLFANPSDHNRHCEDTAIPADDVVSAADQAPRQLEFGRNIWRLCNLSWWVDLVYDGVSNYGRSITRPVMLWLFSIGLMTVMHLGAHFERAAVIGQGYKTGLMSWLQSGLMGGSMAELEGLAGFECSPAFTAWHLALIKAMLVFGWTSSEKLSQDYACLYGVLGQSKDIAARAGIPPVIPDNIALWQLGHSMVAALFFFLILLALRHRYKMQ